jgi:hypothetical protein
MAKTYKVWVCVEEHDDDPIGPKEEYRDLDLPFGAVLELQSEYDAIEFAASLNDAGMALKKARESGAMSERLQIARHTL